MNRQMKRFLFLTLIVAVATLVGGPVFVQKNVRAASVSSSSCNWQVVSSPNDYGVNNDLYSIAALSSTDIWAVGYAHRQNSQHHPLVEHWNGTTWSIVTTPALFTKQDPLYAVSADAANDVWAVGYMGQLGVFSTTLIEHWDGKRWRVIPGLSVGYRSILEGVTAIAPDNVWAVGEYDNYAHILIEHWDGTQWSIVPAVNPGIGDNFYSISAISANDIWAVGYTLSQNGEQTLTEHWDGTQWSVINSPNVQSQSNYLLGVSASATDNVWAVGYEIGSGNQQTLIERWDGTQWSIVPGASLSGQDPTLWSVAVLSSSNVWAVGTTNIPSQTLIEQWDGTQWTQVSSPNPGTNYNNLEAITAVPGTNQLWAVGYQFSLPKFDKTLVESYC